MKRKLTLIIISALLFLSGCTPSSSTDDAELTIACTTYPVYLLTQAVTEQVPSTDAVLVVNQQVSCLHNYTLTMEDMKIIDQANLLVINDDVLDGRTYLDASTGLDLRWNEEEGEYDPHIWMDPTLAGQMALNIATGLSSVDVKHASQYQANAAQIISELSQFQKAMKDQLTSLPIRKLITFHDGFLYFANAFDLDIVASVEEEAGAEASARRIKELSALINQYHLPSVFIEKNGSTSAANALSQECGVAVCTLDMGMNGTGNSLADYEALIQNNINTIREAYK